ncbi:hypothetical protein acdb102_13920 [Acidothermaceae bacterium B102]|nr:hypothetical protein acdb102_13920 [Acidothermaceae bacterium B102]
MSEPIVTDCTRCGHSLDEHDRVALRYCEASGDHGVNRGCICHGQITTAAEAEATFHA